MVGERIQAWVGQLRADARSITDAVSHRARLGDPPLLAPAEDLGVNALALNDAKRQRIRRRRALLGLDYEEFSGVGTKR